MLNALVTLTADVTNIAAEEGAVHNPLIPAWYDIIWSAVCFVIILAVLFAMPGGLFGARRSDRV